MNKFSKHLQGAMVPRRGHMLDSNGGPTIKEHKFFYAKAEAKNGSGADKEQRSKSIQDLSKAGGRGGKNLIGASQGGSPSGARGSQYGGLSPAANAYGNNAQAMGTADFGGNKNGQGGAGKAGLDQYGNPYSFGGQGEDGGDG
jgi:hypothetical protein